MYRLLFDRLFSRLDPELIHHAAFVGIRNLGRIPGVREAARQFFLRQRQDDVEVLGLKFPGRLGLAAGFDKDARAIPGIAALGFAFTEVGTITARSQPGNDKPRLWREKDLRGLRNRMGFNNHGSLRAAVTLRHTRHRRIPVGINIGKSKVTPSQDAARDYAASTRVLAPHADYLVVNVSSPNTPGLRDLQSVERLRPVLEAVRTVADEVTKQRVPLLVKIAPDLSDDDIVAVAHLAKEVGLDGVVAVNTTISHDRGEGGISGPYERERGLSVVRLLRESLAPEQAIIGCGGIDTVDDAHAYLDAGADLLEAYTGFIYNGPAWPGRVNRELAARG